MRSRIAFTSAMASFLIAAMALGVRKYDQSALLGLRGGDPGECAWCNVGYIEERKRCDACRDFIYLGFEFSYKCFETNGGGYHSCGPSWTLDCCKSVFTGYFDCPGNSHTYYGYGCDEDNLYSESLTCSRWYDVENLLCETGMCPDHCPAYPPPPSEP